MTIIVGPRGADPGELRNEIARLEALGADLQEILDGRMPSAEYLAPSPLIDDFYLGIVPRLCIVGHAHGHPLLGTRKIVTSEVKAYAPELGWARTHSRFYRLGRPRGVDRQS
jgi:hypothetical protein